MSKPRRPDDHPHGESTTDVSDAAVKALRIVPPADPGPPAPASTERPPSPPFAAPAGPPGASDLLTRKQANDLLARGYPTPDELLRFPLGDLLVSIPDVDPRYGSQDGKPGHIERVVTGINILLSEHPWHIVDSWRQAPPFGEPITFAQAYQTIFTRGPNGEAPYWRWSDHAEIRKEERDSFFRLLALYHDIGKAVITERHPLVGWHLMKDVHKDQVEGFLYPLILGIPYEEWQRNLQEAQQDVRKIVSRRQWQLIKLFEAVIRFHDYFGILSTGEASLPVAVDLIGLRGMDPGDAQELFSILMIFNLADVYGSIPELLSQKVDVYCADWRVLCEVIAEVKGDRGLFFKRLLELTQTPGAAIDRLWRMMYEGAPPDWQYKIVPDMIEEIFKEATLSRMYPFINHFALFCKLDYCLAFKILLMNTAAVQGGRPSEAVVAMTTLLAELEKRYGDLCIRPDKSWRRLGFEMAGLTRRPSTHRDVEQRKVSRIGRTIADLLLVPGGLGKEWAVSECTVWFMEE
jgi:hypothetical protein